MIMIRDDPADLRRAADRYERIAKLTTDAEAVRALKEMARDYSARADQLRQRSAKPAPRKPT
jgi:hypothetical protein